MFARDMFQISSMIDRFSNLGKPLHVTAEGVAARAADDGWAARMPATSTGAWRLR